MVRWLIVLAVFWSSTAARAEWREAVSKHFIVFSDMPDKEIRQAATDLEQYDYFLRLMMDAPGDVPGKLKIYLMRDVEGVQKTLGGNAYGVAGYYVDTPRGSIAVGVREVTGGTRFDMSSQTVLFHEYAHHLMMQHFKAAYPSWYVEGFAEYYGTTRILPDNILEAGLPAHHRIAILREVKDWIPLNKLLTATTYKDIDNKVHLLYSQGWLLVHYLASNEARRGQLGKYLLAINQGVDRKQAMDMAFGTDATELNRELRAYSRKLKFDAVRIGFPSIDVGPIETRALSAAEAALMMHDIAISRGIRVLSAEEFIEDVRKDAARFGSDPYATALLTEAEYLAGDMKAAGASADRWLSIEPRSPRAQMYKSLTAAAILAKDGSTDTTAWQQARKWVADARAQAPDDPLIMEAFYDTYAMQGVLPPARAQNALYRAMELVPQDYRLRYKVAADFERRGLIEAAIVAIQPAVYRAHSPEDETAREKAKREKREEKFRVAGDEKREGPHEMLARLEAKFLAQTPSEPAESAIGESAKRLP